MEFSESEMHSLQTLVLYPYLKKAIQSGIVIYGRKNNECTGELCSNKTGEWRIYLKTLFTIGSEFPRLIVLSRVVVLQTCLGIETLFFKASVSKV